MKTCNWCLYGMPHPTPCEDDKPTKKCKKWKEKGKCSKEKFQKKCKKTCQVCPEVPFKIKFNIIEMKKVDLSYTVADGLE